MKNKKELRKKIETARDNTSPKEREAKISIISEKFLNSKDYQMSKNILIYYPFRSEIDTTVIIRHILKDKKRLILPKVSGDDLELYFVDNPEKQLAPGAFGIMEPVPELSSRAGLSDVDLAVIPGICFDSKLNRLGYGGGFYDRILPGLNKGVKKIALCFDLQILDRVPKSKNDIKMDRIITELRDFE